MGGLFGLSFGLADVEDAPNLHNRFDQDQAINTLIGAVAGILVGCDLSQLHLRSIIHSLDCHSSQLRT